MKPAIHTGILATICLLCGCASISTLDLDDALTLVPYELQENGRILVDVRIDDRGPYRFALDTAASRSAIFEDLRRELGLEPISETSVTVRGAVATGQFPLVGMSRVQIGNEVWTDARMVILPGETATSEGLAGILGIDFLRRYGVGFSARDRVVRLYAPETLRDRQFRGWSVVQLEPSRIGESGEPLYFFEIDIGGRNLRALFDLGIGLNLMNHSAARFLRLVPEPTLEVERFVGALGDAPILARLESENVQTSGVYWRDEEFMIADIEIFETFMHGDRPLAIVGAGLFNQRDFIIDFARNRLLVRRSAES